MTTHTCPLCGSKMRGRKGTYGIAHLEGFAESLRLLLVEEQYTLHDIALMFGVSRERIRQLADRYGFQERPKNGGLMCVRVWHDGEHRFRPVHKRILHQMNRRERAGKRTRARTDKYEARWQQAIGELRTLARILGRNPTILELSRVLGLGRNPGQLVSYLLSSAQRKSGSSLAPLWEAAGLSLSPRGGPGHTRGYHRPVARSSHCQKGHERTPQNTSIYRAKNGREIWQCRTCIRLRKQGA